MQTAYHYCLFPPMPMDPLRLVITLTSLISSLQKQYDDYNKLQDNKQESLDIFWRAVSRLTDDLGTYQTFVKTLDGHPDFPSFMASGNSADWDGFGLALDKIKSKYSKFQRHELAHSASGMGKRMVASVILSDVVTSSIKQVDAETAKLVTDMEAIESAYKRLYAAFILHSVSYRPRNPPQKFATRHSAIDTVVSSFHQSTFLSTTKISADTLFRLNANRDVADQITKVMEREGASWAEKLLCSDSIGELGRIQGHAMDLLWAAYIPQMESEKLQFASLGDERVTNVNLKELSFGLKSAIARAKTQRFSIAFCGMVKAGKSLFLNALMGQIILPSDELPSTAWPCRLRHVPGQSLPTLTFDPEPFRVALKKLQANKFGSKMQDYKPPSDDPFDDNLDADVPNPVNEDYTAIYYNWKDLHQQTRKNLLEFEDQHFNLPSSAEGRDVAKLLGQLNDIVRLSYRFKLGFSSGSGEWPLLCVQFETLRYQPVEGTFEFIDLPGLGEEFGTFNYEDLITRVATEANAVVPIVSFKEIAKQDWRKLPRIISSGLQTRANMVICTHLDQISGSNLIEQIATVEKVFWSSEAMDRVIPCSSKMGLSAALLRRHPNDKLPKLDQIWNDNNPDDIQYPCVTAILGTTNPRDTYRVFDAKTWWKAVDRQWDNSGLPTALRRLTSDLVAQARQRVLIEEGVQFQKQVRKIIISQERVLLEMRRSRDEFETARNKFQMARDEFTNTLHLWSSQERLRDNDYNKKLTLHSETLQKLGTLRLNEVLKQSSEPMLEMPSESGAESTPVGFIGSKLQTEEFCYKSQQMLAGRLSELNTDFVSAIRKLAEQASRDRVARLREAISAFRKDTEAELRSEILVDLESLDVNVRSLVFQQIRRKLKTERVRYTPFEVFRSFEDAVAKPILALHDTTADDISSEVTIKDLGLLVRAPVAAIATVPYILSAGVWLFMTKTKKYHCNFAIMAKYYQDNIVSPFLQELEVEGSKSLNSALRRSSAVAKATIESALWREEARYERESMEKDRMPSREQVAELVASHLNLVVAESMLLFLKSRLELSAKPTAPESGALGERGRPSESRIRVKVKPKPEPGPKTTSRHRELSKPTAPGSLTRHGEQRENGNGRSYDVQVKAKPKPVKPEPEPDTTSRRRELSKATAPESLPREQRENGNGRSYDVQVTAKSKPVKREPEPDTMSRRRELSKPTAPEPLAREQRENGNGRSCNIQVKTKPKPEPEPETMYKVETTYRAEALYDYAGSKEDPNELAFKKGQILQIIDKRGKWWFGRTDDGSKGILPSNYLRLL